jgi:peptide deformylase
MTIQPILQVPDSRLKLIAEPISIIDDVIQVLAKDLLDTLYAASGLGLTGIHIGVPKRIVVVDLEYHQASKNPMIFINPEITFASKERSSYEESSLSMPHCAAKIERPSCVHINYLDLKGQSQKIETTGLLATCLQHEIDQLNGIMFIEHLSKLKRNMLLKKFTKPR